MEVEALEDLARTVQAVCGVPTVQIVLPGGQLGRWGEDPGEAAWLREVRARVSGGERVMAIGDLLGDRQFGSIRRQAGPGGCRAVLGAPLIWQDRSLGCLLALDTRHRLWSPEASAGIARLARMAASLVGHRQGRAAAQPGDQGQATRIADLEAARQVAAAGLEAAEGRSRAKSAFLANMSHELRTPLNGVVGVIDALAQTELAPRQREMVRLVSDSAQALERILSDILDLSRIEARKLHIEATPIRLDELMQSVCDTLRLRAVEKGLAFEIRIGEGAGERLLGDGVRIRQVLANLLSNAIKFTTRGSVKVRLSAAPRLDPQGHRVVCLEVTDTGPGFAPEAAARLFERFEQADGSVTRIHGGAGLGLAITRELVGLMHGEIEVDSRPGLGATFRVALPLRPAAASARPTPPARPAISEGLRILVAEDHPVNRQVLQLILDPFGFDLTFTENGQEALAALAAQPRGFDLVLMDMGMPVLDGLTATRRIRATDRAQRLPIVMLTGNAGADHQRAAAEAGADVHIAKPVTVDSLLGAISRALKASATERLVRTG